MKKDLSILKQSVIYGFNVVWVTPRVNNKMWIIKDDKAELTEERTVWFDQIYDQSATFYGIK